MRNWPQQDTPFPENIADHGFGNPTNKSVKYTKWPKVKVLADILADNAQEIDFLLFSPSRSEEAENIDVTVVREHDCMPIFCFYMDRRLTSS